MQTQTCEQELNWWWQLKINPKKLATHTKKIIDTRREKKLGTKSKKIIDATKKFNSNLIKLKCTQSLWGKLKCTMAFSTCIWASVAAFSCRSFLTRGCGGNVNQHTQRNTHDKHAQRSRSFLTRGVWGKCKAARTMKPFISNSGVWGEMQSTYDKAARWSRLFLFLI